VRFEGAGAQEATRAGPAGQFAGTPTDRRCGLDTDGSSNRFAPQAGAARGLGTPGALRGPPGRALARRGGCEDPRARWGRGLPDGGGGEAGADLADPECRALAYVASDHGFSAPRLGLEEGEEDPRVEADDAEGLRRAPGRTPEARAPGRTMTPDGELAYDTIRIARRVLLSDGVSLARIPA
jgi:hypothetical protein